MHVPPQQPLSLLPEQSHASHRNHPDMDKLTKRNLEHLLLGPSLEPPYDNNLNGNDNEHHDKEPYATSPPKQYNDPTTPENPKPSPQLQLVSSKPNKPTSKHSQIPLSCTKPSLCCHRKLGNSDRTNRGPRPSSCPYSQTLTRSARRLRHLLIELRDKRN